MSTEFVHLHVHSQFSMLDGAIRIPQLVQSVKDEGMPAVALTDHGNMYGALAFHSACKRADIKPILGCEVYVVQDRKAERPTQPRHFVLLAASQEGYRNLVRIVSLGWVEGLKLGTPCVDLELIHQHRAGLVGMTACMGGELAQEILLKGPDSGRKRLGELKDVFEPGHLFVEMQEHGFPEQKPLNEILVGLARDIGVKVVASNDCHFHHQGDGQAQLALQCIAAGRSLEEGQRLHHGSDQMFLAPAEEMARRFKDLPEALKNTLEVAEMCGGAADPTAKPMLPKFPIPPGIDEATHFRRLAAEGLDRRFDEFHEKGLDFDEPTYRARLERECDVICSMGFPGYFLIVQDFINWGKQQGIPIGPGRGSGAGSLVAYAFRITDLDPLPYGLLFERFLNPERVSMPDFDIDFCMDRREEVIDYVRETYGETSVGQIATFHLLKSKSVVRDAGRVMGFSPADSGRLAGLIPEKGPGQAVPIKEALESEPRLKAAYDDDPRTKHLLDTAQTLEGLTRHAGMHAAGVVISDGPLWDHVPVFCPEEGLYVTQYDKNDVESAGLVKFDFLGLKTLTVVDIACRLIGKRPDHDGQPFRIDRIPMDDAAAFALLQSGETTNVFQLESSGMQGLFKKLKPDCFEDVVAAVALYRPGPLGTGMVDDFVECKHGRKRVEYPHPCLEEILKPTYGVIVYQEQVMQCAQEMAGYTLGGADLLRRAMGKKKLEEMAKQKAIFVEGATGKGYAQEDAVKVFDLMEYFAGYGFNKSHSAAYALITYQTAYLKAHFPVEFMCATLTADKDKTEKVVRSVAEARAMGINVLPPDVNESQIDFSVVYTPDEGIAERTVGKPVCLGGRVADRQGPEIRFGLGGVKGIGESALEAAFIARKADDGSQAPFEDMFDFTARVDLRKMNKGVLEALVQCGAFDQRHGKLEVHRGQAYASIENALDRGRKLQAERASGQTSLFGLLSEDEQQAVAIDKPCFVQREPWDHRELLQRERGTLGFYVSGHPLDAYAVELKRFCGTTLSELAQLASGTEVEVGGVVEGYRERPTRAGSRMAFFEIEDAEGRVEVIVRPRYLEEAREVLSSDQPVLLKANVQFEGDRQYGGGGGGAPPPDDGGGEKLQTKLLLTGVMPLAEALTSKAKAVRVSLSVADLEQESLRALKRTLQGYPGTCPVELTLLSDDTWRVHLRGEGLYVTPTDMLMTQLERMFGRKVAELV